MEEAVERMRWAVARGNRKAEAEAIVDYMRAEIRAWWQDFLEPRLLTTLYRRAALRIAKRGSPDRRRRPSYKEGLQVARALLADIRVIGKLDAVWEAAAVAKGLAGQGLVSNIVPSPADLQEFIERSRSSRVHFDALLYIGEELASRGEEITGPLDEWRREVEEGRRKPPAMKPIPAHRPVNPAQLARDIHMQFTIEILDRVGIRPRGSPSGCSIVAEALPEDSEVSEDAVERIWKAYPWRTPFELMVQQHSPAIAERHGLDQTH